jgi:hypothetical protein
MLTYLIELPNKSVLPYRFSSLELASDYARSQQWILARGYDLVALAAGREGVIFNLSQVPDYEALAEIRLKQYRGGSDD